VDGRLELHSARLLHTRSGGCRSSDLRFVRPSADRSCPLLSAVRRSAADPLRTSAHTRRRTPGSSLGRGRPWARRSSATSSGAGRSVSRRLAPHPYSPPIQASPELSYEQVNSLHPSAAVQLNNARLRGWQSSWQSARGKGLRPAVTAAAAWAKCPALPDRPRADRMATTPSGFGARHLAAACGRQVLTSPGRGRRLAGNRSRLRG
jgi:hypothetical protein